MQYYLDLFHMIFSKWKNSKKLIILTIANLSVGLCILMVFLNAGININKYIYDSFFSSERLRHIIIEQKVGSPIPISSDFLADNVVADVRIIYDSEVEAISIDDVDYSGTISLDITIMQAAGILFEGEYVGGELFEDTSSISKWDEGIILSERALIIFGDDSPLDKMVRFEYNGQDYTLPITAILCDSAEENYNVEYKSYMYVMSDNLGKLPTDVEQLDIRLDKIEKVEVFLNNYDFSRFEVDSNINEIKRILSLSNIVLLLLSITGILFVLFSAIGIINCLSYMHEINLKGICLLKIIGFCPKDIFLLNLFESFLLGLFGNIVSCFMFFGVTFLAKVAKIFDFEFINTESLLNINYNYIWCCLVVSIMIVIVCKIFASKRVTASNVLNLFKNEG